MGLENILSMDQILRIEAAKIAAKLHFTDLAGDSRFVDAENFEYAAQCIYNFINKNQNNNG